MSSATIATFVALAFLIGSLPAGRLVERIWSLDLHSAGSGNVGAGNATRLGGPAAGASLAVLDGLKGLVPVLVGESLGLPVSAQVMSGLAAVAGNNWPIWRTDRGGRGLATSVGVVVAAAPALIVWPVGMAVVGWRIGGGVAGFLGWGLLPLYALAVGAPPAMVTLTAGLGAMMIVRRAQGNAGYTPADAGRRVVADRDDRPSLAPARTIRGAGTIVLVALALGPPAYLWAMGAVGAEVELGAWTATLLLAACATEFGAKWAFGELFREGADHAGARVSRRGAFRAALIATGVARLIPAGGAITPAAMAWSVGHETEGTSGAAVRATVLNYGGLTFATGAGLAWVAAWSPGLPKPVLTGAVGAGMAVLGLALVAFATRFGALLRFVPARFRPRLETVLVDHELTARSWMLLSLRVVLEAATLGLTLGAFGLSVAASQVVVAFGLSQLVGGIPGLPGGLGITEAGLIGALAFFGVPAAVAVAPVLAFRIVSYWLPAIGGVMAGGSRFLQARQIRKAG